MSHHTTRRARALIALVLVGGLGLAACGDDSESPAASGDAIESEDESTTTSTETSEEEAETVEVTGIEYGFQGLEGELAAGTELTFTNGGKEVHELILMRINDDETRSIEELLALPEEEAQQSVTMKGVAVAGPGEDGQVVEGELVADEAGRYAAICFIPVGTTEMPDGPPQEGAEPSGPPHFTQGMVTEITVS